MPRKNNRNSRQWIRKPKPQLKLKSMESEIERQAIESDRIPLVQAAVDFSQAMIVRHYYELSSSVPGNQVKYLKGELEAYRSALSFLKREWDKGCEETKLFESRSRVEDVCE